jgi:hypothetical protein
VLALPFVLKRSNEVISGKAVTSTTERIHGLLRLEGERLVIQWRLARATDHVGPVIRTDHEYEAVREVSIPLAGLAGAAVRQRGWWWLGRSPEIVLTALDLHAFEEVAGAAGFRLDHPAALVLPVPRAYRLTALEFAAELDLALAEREEQPAARARRLGEPRPRDLPGHD